MEWLNMLQDGKATFTLEADTELRIEVAENNGAELEVNYVNSIVCFIFKTM